MSSEDPANYYPYPTKGVVYETPPPAENFPDDGEPRDYSSTNEDDSYDDQMDVDEGDSQPWLEAIAEEPEDDPGVGTFGVELEFLVVQCPKVRINGQQMTAPDVHPNERRWISSRMTQWELDTMGSHQAEGQNMEVYKGEGNDCYWESEDENHYRRARYSRTKLTRVLRDRGLTVIKWPETYINPEDEDSNFVRINDFSESEPSDDEREENFPNSLHINNFISVYDHDPTKSEFTNGSAALIKWHADFEQFHQTHNIRFYRTSVAEIDLAINRCYANNWPRLSPRQLRYYREKLRDRLRHLRLKAKQRREDERNSQVDPLHVPVEGLKPQYKAWTVTVDLSVDGNGMTVERYAYESSQDPYKEYYWFGAEVVSPVLATGDEGAQQAVRDACGSLRDALRCHKPMQVSTGLHIHLGHTKGWTLFQAKRFASLWFVTEKTMLSFHRIDRDQDQKWCAKIGQGSRLWRALFANHHVERRACARATMITYPPALSQVYQNEFNNNIPSSNPNLGLNQHTVLNYIWHYHTINDLNFGLSQNEFCRTGVKWRIRGHNSSLDGQPDPHNEDPDSPPEPGTIEVRIMHGTLDADHINNWVALLEHVVHVVRNLSDREFSALLDAFLLNQTREQLMQVMGVPPDLQQYWLDFKRRDAENDYWEYPDRDLVDWRQPFMVPGHKATHGSYWN